ncbi:hypothetical protein ALP18_200128 [Pseudomonas amygdali pv. myricae]|uniref:Uncharacterized protein n=1 Tax=Pseudomonas amygdali pv. eriobotryae TaxID=129137 RepID=A0A3M3ACY3_PSEA0|nr:hypothetical protein ALQ86_200037 [Pseudomonas amygdali pv. eriobotryae]RMV07694.1 hypothetical protein ALP18_200128 [Pseudomonas amygdali pv. myricae]
MSHSVPKASCFCLKFICVVIICGLAQEDSNLAKANLLAFREVTFFGYWAFFFRDYETRGDSKSLLIQRMFQVSDPKQPVKLPRRGGRRAGS